MDWTDQIVDEPDWQPGDIARTPYEPSGLVKILEIESACWPYGVTACVEFLEDHPHGYAKGSIGRYQLKELRPTTAALGKTQGGNG